MSRVRVYELAKQLSVSNKEVLDLLEEYGMPANNHMSTVDDNAAEFVIRRVRRGRTQPAERESMSPGRARSSDFPPSRLGFREPGRQDDRLMGGPPRRDTSFGPPRRGGRLRQTDVIPAKPAVRFDKPTLDDGKVIKFDTTTYFDARSSSGGMRAIYTHRTKPVEKPKPKVEPQVEAEVKPAAPEPQQGVAPTQPPVVAVDQPVEQTKPAVEPVEPQVEVKPEVEVPVAAQPQEQEVSDTPVEAKPEADQPETTEPIAEVSAPGVPSDGAVSDRGSVTLRRIPAETTRPNAADTRPRTDRFERRPTGGTQSAGAARPVDRPQPMRRPVGGPASAPAPVHDGRDAGRRGKKKDRRRDVPDVDELDRDRRAAGKRGAKRGRLLGPSIDLEEIDLARRVPKVGAKPRTRQQDQSRERRRTKVEKVKTLSIPDTLSVKDLALRLEVSAGDLIKKLMQNGIMATINQEIDFETCEILADEYGVKLNRLSEIEEREVTVEEIVDDPESLVTRPPIVTVLGHVDHGKTSLLDRIRKSRVTETEAGGITQHIGAYQVELTGRRITFIDTPGHEAFTAMRARGAQVTDIAVLVVAADDGVMPQTVEAINHAKAAKVPIIVAVNKIDKPTAQPDRVRQQVSEYGLIPEEWGGETVFVDVSAITGQGIDNLLEMILLVADVRELKANPNRPAKGHVVEAELDKGRGPVATVLVETGTLKVGDTIIAGAAYGRVRAMTNDRGQSVTEAGPSVPVEIIGFSEVPEAGDVFDVVADDKAARDMAAKRQERKRTEELHETQKVSLDDFYARMKEGEVKELGIIVKGDVQGSVEAVCQSLEKLSTDEVKVSIVHSGVGAITESDVMLASTADAIIIGFNVRPDAMARKSAEREKIDVRHYRIIYDAIDDVKKALSGLLEPEIWEKVTGHAEVRAIFKVPKAGTVAGCYVTDGTIARSALIRVVRDGVVVHEGSIESLKRFKDDVREVAEGFECGIGLERYNDIREGDTIEAYVRESVKRSL